jgi:hypothetical protein
MSFHLVSILSPVCVFSCYETLMLTEDISIRRPLLHQNYPGAVARERKGLLCLIIPYPLRSLIRLFNLVSCDPLHLMLLRSPFSLFCPLLFWYLMFRPQIHPTFCSCCCLFFSVYNMFILFFPYSLILIHLSSHPLCLPAPSSPGREWLRSLHHDKGM